MIAEIAAANAAFAVIKGALANGKELHQLGSRVFDYFDNKAKIQEKATQKGGGSDLEEFMALEQRYPHRYGWGADRCNLFLKAAHV